MLNKACAECGVIVEIKNLNTKYTYKCPRCNYTIVSSGERFSYILSMSATALLFFISACFLPLMTFEIGGSSISVTVIDAITKMGYEGYWIISILSLYVGVVLPLVVISLIILILVPRSFNYSTDSERAYLKVYTMLRPWAMAEVYMLAIVVSAIKLKAVAIFTLHSGVLFFILFLVAFYASIIWFNPEDIWQKYEIQK
ncbi:MAG: hypothetical protein GQ570_07745 [Helicobacteraceae bacterium]|nr:hypothetical protein [Helicobacteraceae bacterium]